MCLAKGISAEELLYSFLGRSAKKIFSGRHYFRYIFGLRSEYEYKKRSIIHNLEKKISFS